LKVYQNKLNLFFSEKEISRMTNGTIFSGNDYMFYGDFAIDTRSSSHSTKKKKGISANTTNYAHRSGVVYNDKTKKAAGVDKQFARKRAKRNDWHNYMFYD